MTTEAILQTGSALIAVWAKETLTPEPNRLDAIIEPDDLLAAVTALRDAHWGYLSTITGVDLGVEAGEFELLYHFCAGAAILTLRVRIPRDQPVVTSIYSVIPSVSFYERELIEMFGITIEGTPNTDRLFLPDDWPQGVYPMRKDFNPADA
ncbi:MAG: NADH-quinone oxidoreductase subunit C [Anaerolineae bacterium]|nr:NADH-quinone oxidoreductase subunit C [Anaerolineae bacterium]